MTTPTEEELKNSTKLAFSSLKNESDRGAILVCSSILEEKLEVFIRRKLNQDDEGKKIIDELFTENNAPLATFSSKIKVAYALNIIPLSFYKSLNTLRSIRNDFAHKYIASFEVPELDRDSSSLYTSLTDRVKNLDIYDKVKKLRQSGGLTDIQHLSDFALTYVLSTIVMLGILEGVQKATELIKTQIKA